MVPCKRTQQVTTLLGPTMLRVVGQQCCVRLRGPSVFPNQNGKEFTLIRISRVRNVNTKLDKREMFWNGKLHSSLLLISIRRKLFDMKLWVNSLRRQTPFLPLGLKPHFRLGTWASAGRKGACFRLVSKRRSFDSKRVWFLGCLFPSNIMLYKYAKHLELTEALFRLKNQYLVELSLKTLNCLN